MQKVEAQHNYAKNQPAVRQCQGALLESPQGAQITQLEAMAEASPQAGKLAQLAAMANNSPQATAQRRMMDAIHNITNMTAQRKLFDSLAGETAQRAEATAKPSNTGLPDNLKNGIESLSGMSMDNVRVHYNSSQPAQLNALAYAQGNDIHVAPGQEQHLPHEAWHVVQQAQGRVRPTMQMKEDVPVNDDRSLEHEADVMGARALRTPVDAGMELASGVTNVGSAQMAVQLFQEGRGEVSKKNKETALDELEQIGASDVNPAMERVEQIQGGTLARYKSEYSDYLGTQSKTFQWPITYLRGRASRKNGRLAENGAISFVFPSLSKNNQSYDVHFDPDGADEVVTTIPDFISDEVIGDVKNVKTQSFTEQLRAIYAISKGFDIEGNEISVNKTGSDEDIEIDGPRDFDMIVRSDQHPEGATEISGPLQSAADTIWYVMDK